MTPFKFPEAQMDLQKPAGWTDEQCSPLPIYRDDGKVISCWQANWRERLSVLLFGKVWLWVHSGNTQPPVCLAGTRQIFKEVT